jgi:DHA2 family multidrug resistance protein
LNASVDRQSNLLSFGDAYLLIGLIFLIVLPILLFAAGKKGRQTPAPVMIPDH